MKRQSIKVQQLKGKIASLLSLVKLGIKKYVIQLLDLEAVLAQAQDEQLFSETQIREAFQKVAGDFRYWKAEMARLIPQLIGQGLRECDPWQHWIKFAPVQEMEQLGYKDRVISLAIQAANLLGA